MLAGQHHLLLRGVADVRVARKLLLVLHELSSFADASVDHRRNAATRLVERVRRVVMGSILVASMNERRGLGVVGILTVVEHSLGSWD